jgi:hypothetical protein
MLPGITEIHCDEKVVPAHQSPLVDVPGMTRCAGCRMPPVVFDSWGLPWCSSHWEEEKKKYRTGKSGKSGKSGNRKKDQ